MVLLFAVLLIFAVLVFTWAAQAKGISYPAFDICGFLRLALLCRCADILSNLSPTFRSMQFPWVALANCGSKYLDGISLKGQADSLGAGRLSKQAPKNPKKVQYDKLLH